MNIINSNAATYVYYYYSASLAHSSSPRCNVSSNVEVARGRLYIVKTRYTWQRQRQKHNRKKDDGKIYVPQTR